MLTSKHLWLPAMAAAILTAGLVMPAAHAFNPQPDPPGKLRAGQKTIGNPEIRKNRRTVGDPNQRAIIDPAKRRKVLSPPGYWEGGFKNRKNKTRQIRRKHHPVAF